MRSPRDFFKPLAIGAPQPVSEIPLKPSRMIHFFDPSNERMAAKIEGIAKKVDILLGNLEDAVQADNKVAAREGLVKIASSNDFGDTQLWWAVRTGVERLADHFAPLGGSSRRLRHGPGGCSPHLGRPPSS